MIELIGLIGIEVWSGLSESQDYTKLQPFEDGTMDMKNRGDYRRQCG